MDIKRLPEAEQRLDYSIGKMCNLFKILDDVPVEKYIDNDTLRDFYFGFYDLIIELSIVIGILCGNPEGIMQMPKGAYKFLCERFELE